MPQSTKSAKRKSTGKRLRFSVFHRDHFTCQYCGAQPPDVVLVVDHIIPVIAGGETEIDNLITACETCNQGKADRTLTARPMRPDVDLLLLEAQQEIAEVRRYQQYMVERNAALVDAMEILQHSRLLATGKHWAPDAKYFMPLAMEYGLDIVDEAIVAIGPKIRGGYVADRVNDFVPYLTAICRNKARERETE